MTRLRVLLVALNARYVHTSLALRYLREAIKPEFPEVMLKEFTINEHTEKIAAEIYEVNADVIGFSCYIWNIAETLKVIRHLHPVCPHVRFVLGGPEVSFESEELFKSHPEIDAIVVGEGEIPFPQLLQAWKHGLEPDHISGLVWRRGGGESPQAYLENLSDLPMPYGTNEDFRGRIVYVETTRGCPFNCEYCLSSTFSGMRYLEADIFRAMFRRLLSLGARTIKFVDRTFNVRKDHSFRILDVVREEAQGYGEVRVHCEMAGDLLDDEWLNYLANYPPGLIQLEIGVQSTHLPTLEIISRVQRFEKWKDKVYTLQNVHQIPVHLDLIAGLPLETFERFSQSFNEVYRAYPNRLQLGFLKVLKGSGIRLKSEEYGLKYSPDPPYTVLETSHIAHAELLQLARIEELLEKYYNSCKFRTSLNYLLTYFSSPFAFYDEFARFWQENGWFKQSVHGKSLFERLWVFIRHLDGEKINELDSPERSGKIRGLEKIRDPGNLRDLEKLRDALRFDYYLWERPSSLPEFLGTPLEREGVDLNSQREEIRQNLHQNVRWKNHVSNTTMDRRQWARATAVGYFTHEVAAVLNPKISRVLLVSDQVLKTKIQDAELIRGTEETRDVKIQDANFQGVELIQGVAIQKDPEASDPEGYWYLFLYRSPVQIYLITNH